MILTKAIKPAKLKQGVFRSEFLAGMRDIERAVIKEFEKTTATWEGEKPTFKALRSLRQATGLELLIGPSGNEQGVKKWEWLDKGTKIRYATMSPDWESKTTPNIVGSKAGRGKLLFVRKDRPRPGIEARNWTAIIAKNFAPRFKRRMEEAMRIAVRKSGHKL